jgi:hypothetical protein
VELELAVGTPLVIGAIVGNLRALHGVFGGLADRGIEAAVAVAPISGAFRLIVLALLADHLALLFHGLANPFTVGRCTTVSDVWPDPFFCVSVTDFSVICVFPLMSVA